MRPLTGIILSFLLLLGMAVPATGLAASSDVAFAAFQEVPFDQELAEGEEDGFSAGDLWALTEKAGPLRWPIIIVFIIGMFLVSLKMLQLWSDKREARELEALDVRHMDLDSIVGIISRQRDSMTARLHATLINVFQTQKARADLHEEIANFVTFQQDRFDTFKRRVDFLSDTSGALGLLGTVWGIFTVFSQGLLDDQVILTGMGFALITTLMGLVASIILNLTSTEVFSYFNGRLDTISNKADELRFRLMELAGGPQGDGFSQPSLDVSVPASTPVASVSRPRRTPAPSAPATAPPPAAKPKPIAQIEAVFEDRIGNNAYNDAAATVVQQTAPPKSNAKAQDSNPQTAAAKKAKSGVPHVLTFENPPQDEVVGNVVKQMRVVLTDEAGKPVANEMIRLSVSKGKGTLTKGKTQVELKSDAKGACAFDWQLDSLAGEQAIEAAVVGGEKEGPSAVLILNVKPGPPRKLKQSGNNQGGPAGKVLPKALIVQVLDEFENPIPDWPVSYTIELGGGLFEDGQQALSLKTNSKGEGVVRFKVGPDPGFNTVKVVVEGVNKELKFQAMSMA